jgi:outer membrane protein TolC
MKTMPFLKILTGAFFSAWHIPLNAAPSLLSSHISHASHISHPPPDTLSVAQCRALAVQMSPLQDKKLFADNIAALQLLNLRGNSLPRIGFGAQATWQSDVFALPIENPAFKTPQVPKDQYRLSADIGQRIWDGGADRFQRQQRELERDLTGAQTDVEAFQVREVVTDLYFKALLLAENEAVLRASKEDLQNRLKQTEAAVQEGVALRSTADQVRIQILKTEQQIDAANADKEAVLEVLGKWVGRPVATIPVDLAAAKNGGPVPAAPGARPEFKLFSLQQRSVQLGKEALTLRNQPRVEAFAQTGLGRPNPFNFFETDLNPFLLIGLRASWTPVDWGNRKRDAQIFDLQYKNIATQRAAFEQRLDAATVKDHLDAAKYEKQLRQDDAIIALQEDIVQRADAQVKNGVMTATDYLAQLNLLTQARLAKKAHEVQMAQAREMWRAKMGE